MSLGNLSTRLYFAYGSNLNVEQMQERCPTAVPIRALTIRGWWLAFRRYLDIVPAPGGFVHGALYSVTRRDELALDEYEGVAGGHYRQFEFRILGKDGVAFAYRMTIDHPVEPPSARYLEAVAQGFGDWQISTDTLEAALIQSHRASTAGQLEAG